MRRILVIALASLWLVSGLAAQSNFLVVGGSSYGKLSADLAVLEGNSRWSSLKLEAWAGISIAPGLEIGPQVIISNNREKTISGTVYDSSTSSVGVQVGYFFLSGSNLIPFVRGAALYRKRVSETDGILTSEDSYYQFSLSAGTDLLFAGNVALSLGATLQYYESIPNDYYNLNLAGFLGLDIFLPI